MNRYEDRMWNSEDPTVRARVRGRAITSALARLVKRSDEGAFWVDMRSALSGGQPLYNAKADNGREGQPILDPRGTQWKFGSALNHVWHFHTPEFGEDHPNA